MLKLDTADGLILLSFTERESIPDKKTKEMLMSEIYEKINENLMMMSNIKSGSNYRYVLFFIRFQRILHGVIDTSFNFIANLLLINCPLLPSFIHSEFLFKRIFADLFKFFHGHTQIGLFLKLPTTT